MSERTELLEPAATKAGDGEAYWWLGSLAEVKVSAEQTGGLLSILEITAPPNEEAPLHVHHHEDESFWILEGEVTLEVGDEVIQAGPGDFAFGPRNVPHRYTVGPEGCRMLFIMTPGGFEGMVRKMSVPAEARTLPPDTDEEPDWEAIAAIAAEYGGEVLG